MLQAQLRDGPWPGIHGSLEILFHPSAWHSWIYEGIVVSAGFVFPPCCCTALISYSTVRTQNGECRRQAKSPSNLCTSIWTSEASAHISQNHWLAQATDLIIMMKDAWFNYRKGRIECGYLYWPKGQTTVKAFPLRNALLVFKCGTDIEQKNPSANCKKRCKGCGLISSDGCQYLQEELNRWPFVLLAGWLKVLREWDRS